MNPKIVILGSTGFIGAALLEKLQHENKVLVEGYNSSTLSLISPDCVDRLGEVVNEATVLIITARSRKSQDPFESFSKDITIATNVARYLSKQRVKKCLYFSTTSVYGEVTTNLCITEETEIVPTSLYGLAKYVGESVLRQVAKDRGIPLVVLRPCMVFGPGDTSRTYGPARFIESILREGKVRLFGDGTELRDYLFIRDLVEITIQFAFEGQSGTYNLATGHSHSFQEIIACLQKMVEQEFDVVHVERDRPKVDLKINPVKLLATLPGFSFTELEQGLEETCRYALAIFHKEEYNKWVR